MVRGVSTAECTEAASPQNPVHRRIFPCGVGDAEQCRILWRYIRFIGELTVKDEPGNAGKGSVTE